MRPRSLFSYVVDHDYGINPNPVGGLCTLAQCKFKPLPTSRRNVIEMAEVGDWIAGTGGRSRESAGNGKLIYAMRVTRKIPLSRYQNDTLFSGRADQYGEVQRTDGRFVLISSEFYYFGKEAIEISRIPSRHLSHPFEKWGQRHRRDFSEAFIVDFEQWLQREFAIGIHGEPCVGRPTNWSAKTIACRPRRFRIQRSLRKPGCPPRKC
ncbi:MAG TPA: hypothetical protein VGN07_06650 [Steroidobacteraceae bacterium]|jgi:hypothetical protein